jgi:uncharacterized membrane protein
MKSNLRNERLLGCFSLLIALLVGSYLRLRNLTVDALWLDEVFSVATSHPDNSFLEVYRRTLIDVHPPLYQLVLWVFYKVFGFGEMVGRYLSVVFGVLLIPVAYLSGRQLFNGRVGVFAAWLVAINFYLITYSQETRSYELLALLTMVSFFMFVKAVRTVAVLPVAGYSLVAALVVNTHYFGFLVVASQALFVVCKLFEVSFNKRIFYRFGMAAIFIMISLSPHVSFVLENFNRQGFWIPSPNDLFFIELFYLYFGSLSLAAIFSALLLAALTRLGSDEQNREVLRLFVFWFVVCAMLPYMRSLYFQPVLTMRSLIVLLPGLLILLAYGLSLIRDGWIRGGVAVVVLCFSMTPLYTDYKPESTFENQLKPVSRMRDLIQELINEQIEAPLYSRQYIEFGQYFKLLGSSIEIKREEDLLNDLKSSQPPAVFYLLASRGIPLPDDVLLKRYNVVMVGERRDGDSLAVEYRTAPDSSVKK